MNNLSDLIQRITNAIFRQEGMGPDHQNPGNLRDCPWFPKSLGFASPGLARGVRYYPDSDEPVQFANSFWVPRSRAEGIAGAAHVVALHIAEGDSLRKLISIWAPPTDGNDTELYIQHVAEWAKIPDVNLPLWNFIMDTIS